MGPPPRRESSNSSLAGTASSSGGKPRPSTFWITFPEAQLGLSLVLAQTSEPGNRRLVIVERTFPERGAGVAYAALKAGDELVAVGADGVDEVQFYVTADDADSFARLLTCIREAPRPLRLLFARVPPAPADPRCTPVSKPTRRRKLDDRRCLERAFDHSSDDEYKERPPSPRGLAGLASRFRLCILLWLAYSHLVESTRYSWGALLTYLFPPAKSSPTAMPLPGDAAADFC